MYLQSWHDFAEQAKELYTVSPGRTRFHTRYRHCDGVIVLKVTDDRTCLKYKTDQQSELKHIERLNTWFMERMSEE